MVRLLHLFSSTLAVKAIPGAYGTYANWCGSAPGVGLVLTKLISTRTQISFGKLAIIESSLALFRGVGEKMGLAAFRKRIQCFCHS